MFTMDLMEMRDMCESCKYRDSQGSDSPCKKCYEGALPYEYYVRRNNNG